MKKICIITNHYYMLWQFRRELILELKKHHQVVLIMPFVGHEEDFKALGLRCIECAVDRRSINPAKDLKLMQTYRRLLKQEKPDLVVTYSIKPNVYGGLVCSQLKIPFYANVQGLGTAFQNPILSKIVTAMYSAAFRKVEKVFFENEPNAQLFRDLKIVKPEKQVVLAGAGINTEHFALEPYPTYDKVRFLHLGRLMREKGMDEILYAIRRLHQEGEAFDLDLVGFFDDDYKQEVEALVNEGIATFHGFQPEPRPYYAAASCVLIPSHHEGMSNVILEAAATGRPVIVTDIPGCREAVEHGVTGLLVRAKDGQSLYEAMKEIIHTPHQQREEMGKLGRAKMERQFRKEMVVAQTVEALGLKQPATV